MKWIDTITPHTPRPEAEEIFQDIKRNFVNITSRFKVYSHNLPLLKANRRKGGCVMAESLLSRKNKEAIALLVSKDNGCEFCVASHSRALRAIGISTEEISLIETDLELTSFTDKERALICFAREANRSATGITAEDFAAIRGKGASDPEIIEALGVMEVFAIFSRFVGALDVEND